VQQLQDPPVGGLVELEVKRPHVIGALGDEARRDSGHPYTKDGFGPAVLDRTSDSYDAIRGREQQLIDFFRQSGLSANKINGVGPRNPAGARCQQQAFDAFGPLP